jgi:sugar lactone lactonase YvrE
MDIVMDGLAFGESLRWRDDRVWVADWARGQVWSCPGDGGERRLEATVESFPLCFDHDADGRLLLLDSAGGRVLRREPDGALATWADLGELASPPWNEIVAHPRGGCFVDTIGFAFPEEEFAPGSVVHVAVDGTARVVAHDLAFPNGLALTDDGTTLLVAESYGECVTAFDVADDGGLSGRRVWAATPGDHPDGICVDAQGALWVADVGRQHCLRVAEGGEVLDTVDFDRGAFSCVLSTDPEHPRLYVVGQYYTPEPTGPTGLVAAYPAPAPAPNRLGG